jgi:hypothetical protein
MKARVKALKDEYALARVELCDPEGRTYTTLRGLDTAQGKQEAEVVVEGRDLEPGVWELMVYGDFRSAKASKYEGMVEFFGIQEIRVPPISLDFSPGKTPRGSAEVMNRFNKAVWAEAKGDLWGYSKTRTVEMKEKDTWSYGFSLDENLKSVRFKISMSPEDYGLFTDYAINILDSKGNALVKDGLSNRFTELEFFNPGGKGSYTLKMVAGYAHKKMAPFSFELTEAFIYNSPVPMDLSTPGAGRYIPLIPDITTRVDYTFRTVPPMAPKGFAPSASIVFRERGTGSELFRLHLKAKI